MRTRMKKKVSPLSLLCIMNILGFFLLSLKQENLMGSAKMIIMGVIFITLMMISYCLIKVFNMGDPYLILPVTALMTVGILMLCRIDKGYGERQMLWFVISVATFFISYFIYRLVKIRSKIFWFYGGASIALFITTLIFGRNILGAKNWIYIGNQGFQPSELIRILYVLAIASLLVKAKDTPLFRTENRKSLAIMLYAYFNMGFLVIQREWGIAVLFFVIYASMFFVFGKRPTLLLLNGVISCMVGFIGYKSLYHIQTRVQMWMDPFSDPSGRGYQIVQSLVAMASGGFVGSGFTEGSPEYVPLVQSDFIFSAICEEFGLLGGIGIILLFFILVYRGFKISLGVKDKFDKAVALGISAMFAFQTFIILGGVIKLIPLTGITLPFISYGGSSLVTNFMALGILQAISVEEGDSIE